MARDTLTTTPYASKLFSIAIDTITLVSKQEAEKIDAAASMLAKSISSGGMLHIFGAGHSHLFAEEMSCRAGGLVAANPILDIGYTLMGGPPSLISKYERLEGFVTSVLGRYKLRTGEVLIVMSQSGRNPGPVEAALYAMEKGLQVIAITSVGQSREQASRHSSGKRLFEIADLVIDNHVPTGDAAVELKEGLPKVSPISTIIGAAILQSLVAEVAGRMLQMGEVAPVWMSSNVDGGDEHNELMASRYQSLVKSFQSGFLW